VFELSETHPGRIQDEQRQPIPRWQYAVNCEHVFGRGWHDLRLLLTGEAYVDAIPGGVRLDAGMVKHHR
jgi:hypothetical protein